MRLLQTRNLVLIALAVAAYGSQACTTSEQDDLGASQKTTQASSVSIHLEDSSGNDIGSCAGTLVAEKLVLTAGHCVVNASTWRVEGAGKVVSAKRAVTPWKQFKSTLSHPKHADIALLVLDDAIKIARYPGIASEGLKDGAKATRMHRSASGSKEFVSTDTVVKDGAAKGFHLTYTAEMPKGEWLDTGGALFDSRGKIYGVVSAQGKKTSLLYITRVEGFNQWLTDSVDECGDSGSALGVRTWGGGWGGSSSGGWGGGGWGGYGGDGKKIEAGAPPSSVDAGTGTGTGSGGTGSGTTNGGSGTGGGTGAGTGGGDGSGTGGTGSSSSTSGPPGPNDNGEVGSGANSGATCPPKPPSSSSIPGGTGGAGSEGSGTNGGTENGANPSGGTGTGGGTGSGTGTGTGAGTGGGTGGTAGTGTGTGGGTGSSTGAPGSAGLDEEVCEGADDNPAICPPDGPLCDGPSCGGCAGVASCVDGTMDYGNCACEAPNTSLGNPDGLR